MGVILALSQALFVGFDLLFWLHTWLNTNPNLEVSQTEFGISIEQFWSWIGSHDNFVKTKTRFILVGRLGRYSPPGHKPVLEGFQSKFKLFDA